MLSNYRFKAQSHDHQKRLSGMARSVRHHTSLELQGCMSHDITNVKKLQKTQNHDLKLHVDGLLFLQKIDLEMPLIQIEF